MTYLYTHQQYITHEILCELRGYPVYTLQQNLYPEYLWVGSKIIRFFLCI